MKPPLWLSQYFYLYIVDHGVLRLLYSNLHRLPGALYRSNQPSPAQLRRYRRRFGIKTVFNVRGGDRSNPAWQLEAKECEALGIKLVDLRILSRSCPYVSDLLAIKEAIAQAEFPALVHCKSGADRAGFFSVLYRVFRLGEPVEVAVDELSLRYGHVRWAQTGILDRFFEEFSHDRRNTDIGLRFEDWAANAYDRERLKLKFRPRGLLHQLGSFVVDRILRRE